MAMGHGGVKCNTLVSAVIIIVCCLFILVFYWTGNYIRERQSQGRYNNLLRLDIDTPIWNRLRDRVPGTSTKSSYRPIILFWSGFYLKTADDWPIKKGIMDCGAHQCVLSSDKKLHDKSSALVFHHRNPFWVDEVSILRRGNWSRRDQIYVVYNRESSLWQPKGKGSLDEVNGMINWTMGLRRDDDIFVPTAKIIRGRHLDGYDPNKNYMEGKAGFTAALLTSNCWILGTDTKLYAGRRAFINALRNAGLDFDTYGYCGQQCGDYENCASYLKNYKFVLAFENSLCDDYLSEKPFANGLGIGSVPIVASLANITDPYVLPPGSFINALNFSNPYALIRYMRKVGSNPKLYNKFFEWRNEWTFKMISVNEGHVNYTDDYFCPLCHKLHDYAKNPYTKIISNYTEWYEQAKCRQFPTYNYKIY